MNSEMEVLSETQSDHDLRKQDSHALLHDTDAEHKTEKVTAFRLFAILALAATYTGTRHRLSFMQSCVLMHF